MPVINKPVDAYQFPQETRITIPSKEEAGTEKDNPKVKENQKLERPLPNPFPMPNPIKHRSDDPALFWKDKFGENDDRLKLSVDVRSLYRYEHISPESLIKNLYRTEEVRSSQLNIFEQFGNAREVDELEKVSEYYQHQDGWTNRLIQGDSLLVMSSLLERENMTGKVQMIYFDPPYGIKYGSNWQMKLNNREVKDGSDDHLTSEPEQIKAFRDTWLDGVHSYLSYLRDRLLVARELLTESGSCFVQISDENVHLVRCLMDEVFGSENFISLITYRTTGGLGSKTLSTIGDYLIWYAKDSNNVKYRQLFVEKSFGGDSMFKSIQETNGLRRNMNTDELRGYISKGNRPYRLSDLVSSGLTSSCVYDVKFNDRVFSPRKGYSWKTNQVGMENLINKNRIEAPGNTIQFVRYFDDFPVQQLTNFWEDTVGELNKGYVVQTSTAIIQRCLLMCTDPGDLVLDPTCGSGTTAYVSEQWGRRWITVDTSRIALNIAKTRLMTATFPYYFLHSDVNVEASEDKGKIKKKITPKIENSVSDIRQGFVYEEVPHITLKSLANDEPPETETLYDRPYEDKKRFRVAGPFTVETLQAYEVINPETLDQTEEIAEDEAVFEQRIFEHLRTTGVRNGDKNEQAIFVRVERLADDYLHAEGFYRAGQGERKAYLHIGPKYGTVSKDAVNKAVKECRRQGDADWLIILGFAFESDIENRSISMSAGNFQVSKVRMNDDLLQEGLLKKDKKAGSFVTIGEPDIAIVREGENAIVEIRGMDIYDPIRDEVKPRNVADIAYWMLDDDYNSTDFMVKQVFFCGGDKDEFDKWKKGISNIAKQSTKIKVETTLKVEIDEDAFDRLYGFQSHPIPYSKGKKVAVRVISQFGEESTKILKM